MSARFGLFSSLVALALTGCISVPPPQEKVPPPTPPVVVQEKEVVREKIVEAPTVSDTDRLLAYYAYVASLAKDQSAKELEQAKRLYETNGGNYARMQLALARLAVNNEQREHDKALELLQAQLSVKHDSPVGLKSLAALLKQLLSENRQLESNLESQKDKLKEEIKKSEALKQKLDALIEAERKMLERNRPKQ